MKIHITCVYNYFDPLAPGGRDLRHLPWEAKTVRDLVEVFHPPRSIDGYDLVATVDGALFTAQEVWDLTPAPGASVVFALVPQGGGNGKNPLAAVAMLAVMIVAYIYAPPIGAAMSAYIGAGSAALYSGIAYAAITIAGAALVNAVLPPGMPDPLGQSAGLANSPTYGWGADSNAIYEGGTLPVLYGTHRVVPPRLGKYISTGNDGKQVLNLLFAVAGHELDAIDNVEINDTPYADYNDSGAPASITVTTRLGANDQTAIPEFLDTYAETPVGVELGNSWTTRQTAGNTAEGLGVFIILPKGLFYAGDSGQLVAQSVDLLAEYRLVGDVSWTSWLNNTITAADNSAIHKYFRQDNLTAGQYDVRVKLTSTQAVGMRYANDVWWESLQEIVYDDFACPGVSLLAVKIIATDKLSGGIPTVACRAVRNNVTVWNGSADVSKPANLPPWICCDILRNEEYGGQADKTRLVYAAFSDWADWCTENSLACNIYFDSAFSLRKALDAVGLLGRGVVVQMGSRFTCIVDKPEELPVQRFLFTAGNIVKDSFNIGWLPYEGRANALEVTYFDAGINYSRQSFLLMAHDFETTDRPVDPAAITLVGCTSRAMAIKHGTAQLKRNRYLTMMPSWTAAVDSIACMPGDVVEVANDRPQWGFSGRAVTATNNTIQLDRQVTLQPGATYMVTVLHADDDSREDRYVTAVEAETTTDALTLTANWTDNPAQYDQYSFGEENHVTQLVRIGRITRSQEMRRKITALEYIAAAYDDDATIGVYEATSSLTDVADLRAEEIYKYRADGIGYSVVSLTWRGQALKWQVFYRLGGDSPGPWIWPGETRYPAYEIQGLTMGVGYDFAITSTGAIDPANVVTLTYSGLPTAAPETPTDFTASLSGQFITLAWPAAADIRVAGYSIYLNGSLLVANSRGTQYVYRGNLAAGTYDFTLKTVDQYQQLSDPTAAASITISVPSTPSPAVVAVGELAVVTWASCQTSLPIDHYAINTVAASNALRYQERIAWTSKAFSIVAVDIAGNQGAAGSVTLTISSATAVTGITATGLTYAVKLSLSYSTFADFDAIEIWSGTVNNRANAVKVGESAAASWTHNGLALTDTRYYWTRIRDKYGNYGTWYPSSATSGVPGSTSTDPADYLTVLIGGITRDQLGSDLRTPIDGIDTDSFFFEPGVFEPGVCTGLRGAFYGLANKANDHNASIQDLIAITLAHATGISGLQGEIAGLTTSVWSSTEVYIIGRYVSVSGQVWRATQDGTGQEPYDGSAYWEKADAISTLVSNIDDRVDTLEGQITTTISTTTFNALENRVTAGESEISQNAEDILLRATKTEFSAFSTLLLPEYDPDRTYPVNFPVRYMGQSYKTLVVIDFLPAPLPTNTDYWEPLDYSDEIATMISQIAVNAGNISLESSTIIGPYLAFEPGCFEPGCFVESVEDVKNIDCRITQAGINIDGANAIIALHAFLIDGIGGRLSQAGLDIDGANAQISLKASQESLDSLGSDLTMAKIIIDGHTAAIALKVAISTYDSKMTALDGSISSQGGRLAAAEFNIGGLQTADGTLQSNINAKVAISTYDSKMTALDGSLTGLGISMAAAEENIGVLETVSGDIQAQFTIKLSARGHIAGIGLMLDGVGSEFAVLSNKFKFLIPDPDNPDESIGDPIALFAGGLVNGVPTIGVNGNLVIDGSILARHLALETLIVDQAQIGALVVGTSNIADSAVTNVQSAYTAGALAIEDYSPFLSPVQSLTITTAGGVLTIFASIEILSSNQGTTEAICFLRLQRGGATALTGGQNSSLKGTQVNLHFVEQPSAGTYTYYLYVVGGGGNFFNRALTIMENKK